VLGQTHGHPIRLTPGSCRDLPTLLAHADRAMYEAKRAGGGCWRLYEDTEQAADSALA
jgi:GGDEF domain-containing protein